MGDVDTATRLRCTFLVAMVTMGVAACGGGSAPDPGPPRAQSSVTEFSASHIAAAAPVSGEEMPELVTGLRAFALDVQRAALEDGQNSVAAHHSLAALLGMTAVGANDTMSARIAATLHLDQSFDFSSAISALLVQLRERHADAGLTLDAALWGQSGYLFNTDYLQALNVDFDAALDVCDFRAMDSSARNDTDERDAGCGRNVPGLEASEDTRVVLQVSTRLDTSWSQPFLPMQTYGGRFELMNGHQIEVETMHQAGTYNVARGSDYDAIELPLGDGELALLIVMPDPAKFDAVVERLDVTLLDEVARSLSPALVNVALPRFAIDANPGLGDDLLTAVTAGADETTLAGVNGAGFLDLAQIEQYAQLVVDEHGVRIDDSSVAVLNETANEPESLWSGYAAPVVLTHEDRPSLTGYDAIAVVRPFLFFVYEPAGHLVLFSGSLIHPDGAPVSLSPTSAPYDPVRVLDVGPLAD